VTGLVPQVPEHRAVGLGEPDPQLLAVAVVALGQVDGHDAGGVPDGDVLLGAGQQVERQAGAVGAGEGAHAGWYPIGCAENTGCG
jgi:hypothetical protein